MPRMPSFLPRKDLGALNSVSLQKSYLQARYLALTGSSNNDNPFTRDYGGDRARTGKQDGSRE